jgi:hypothetical protein
VILLKYKADPHLKNYLNEDSFDYADRYLLDLELLVRTVGDPGEL